jgi:putative transcriptional regulator
MKKELHNPYDIKTPRLKIRPGILLVAPTLSNDLYFNKTVVLIVEHNENGSVGFVINKPTEFLADKIISGINNFDSKIFFGGPVQVNTLHFIHSVGESITNTEKVTNSIYWGGDFEEIYKKINNGEIDNRHVKFFLGYSGWAPGQLENELNMNYWHMVPSEKYLKYIWEDSSQLWQKIMTDFGINKKLINIIPPDPSLN